MLRPTSRWESIKVHLNETVLDDVDWIHVAQDRGKWRVVVNTGDESYGCIEC